MGMNLFSHPLSKRPRVVLKTTLQDQYVLFEAMLSDVLKL
jgi:hypothetical protein